MNEMELTVSSGIKTSNMDDKENALLSRKCCCKIQSIAKQVEEKAV